MKKTLSLIFVTTCCAMAATEPITLTDKWTENTADISKEKFTGEQVTFAITLDSAAIEALSSNKQPIAYVSGTNQNGATVNLGVCENGTETIATWSDIDGSVKYPGYRTFNNDNDYEYLTLVVAINTDTRTPRNTKVKAYLFLWDDDLNNVYTPSVLSNTFSNTYMSGYQYTGFTINTDFIDTNSVALYSGNPADATAAKELAKAVLEASIPEPTTATLSLLALASLAMRRRRK